MQVTTVGAESPLVLTQVTSPLPSSVQFETCEADPGVTLTQLDASETLRPSSWSSVCRWNCSLCRRNRSWR